MTDRILTTREYNQITPSDDASRVLVQTTETEIIVAEGKEGPQGPIGLPGPSGTGDKNYTHNQSTPATTWAVAHNLGKFPSVDVVDSGGTHVVAEVRHIDTNNLEVLTTAAFSGKAYCN